MKFLLSDDAIDWPKPPQAGDIGWTSIPGPQGGWGRFRTGDDGTLEFISFVREPPTGEEITALVQLGVDWGKEEKE